MVLETTSPILLGVRQKRPRCGTVTGANLVGSRFAKRPGVRSLVSDLVFLDFRGIPRLHLKIRLG